MGRGSATNTTAAEAAGLRQIARRIAERHRDRRDPTSAGRRRYLEGVQAWAAGDHDSAERLWREVLADDQALAADALRGLLTLRPDDHQLLQQLYERRDQLGAYDRYGLARPRPTWTVLGNARQALLGRAEVEAAWAISLADRGRLDEAWEVFNGSSGLDARMRQAVRTRLEFEAGDWERACASALQLANDPELGDDSLLIAASSQCQLGNWDAAVAPLEVVLRRSADCDVRMQANYMLGRVLEQQGRQREAAVIWRELFDRQPDYADVASRLGLRVDQPSGRDPWPEALEAFLGPLAHDPHVADPHLYGPAS
jgi:tetratricopeptide (TPR) repeat protein